MNKENKVQECDATMSNSYSKAGHIKFTSDPNITAEIFILKAAALKSPMGGFRGPLYSVLKLFTGLANAALILWKLMVSNAMMMAANPEIKKIHQLIVIRYW